MQKLLKDFTLVLLGATVAAAVNALFIATQLPAFTKLVQGGIFVAPTVGAATLAGTTKAADSVSLITCRFKLIAAG